MKKIKPELNKKQIEQVVKGVQSMAHPVRFTILYSLLNEEQSVGDLSDITGVSQSVTSQHLSKMKDFNILDSRKESNKVFYFIKDERFKEIIRSILKFYNEVEKPIRKK
jgi:ArsR family transcriptional regulator, virulence genes transcriptional regulator